MEIQRYTVVNWSGKASWYGEPFHGRRTASGEIYDMYKVSAAHRTLPFGTEVWVTNPRNGRSLKLEITDRGPYSDWKGVHYYDGHREMDLSMAAARELGVIEEGIAMLEYRRFEGET